MNFFTRWVLGDAVSELKLAQNPVKAKASMPKAPVLDVSAASLARYARASELVYACIEKKAQAACDAELVVQKKVGDKWENIVDHPALAVLNKPNPFDDGESFMRSWVASENVTDVFYAEIVRSGAGVPVGLYPLLPQNVAPQYKFAAGRWVLDYYSYQIDGIEVRFAPEELLIRRRHSLGSVFGGVSAMQVALGSVDADTALTEYVRAFFNNGGQPSGVLNIEGRALKDEEIEAIQQKWTTRFGRRGRQQGGVAVLDKTKAKYEAVGSKLTELESEGLTSINEARVCMGFGVPPILIGAYVGLVNVNQKASFKGAMEEFWQGTMSPELKSIRNFLTWNFLPEFEDVEQIKKGLIRFNWDISQVDALQEDLDSIYKRMGAAVKDGFITPNEARSKLGFEPLDGGDDLRPAQNSMFGQEPVEQPKKAARRFQLKAATAHEFSSTQVDIPAEEKKVILAFGKEFIADDDLADNLDWDPREDKPHITVKFGLHADNADELKALFADVAPFEVTLRGTSIFPGNEKNDYDVVKLDVESPALHAINKLISDNLETTDTHPKYIPHLTLAYVKKGKGADYDGDETFDGQKILFDKIIFSDKNRKKTIIKLTGAKSQKKTFDLDGLILSREPTEIERQIDLKALNRDFETNRQLAARVLLRLRDDLLKQAFTQVEEIEDDKIHTIILTPTNGASKNLKKALRKSFADGRSQIARELSAQKNQTDFEVKDKSDYDGDENLSDITISRVINEIQSRFSAELAALRVLGLTGKELVDKLKDKFKNISDKFFEQIAGRAAQKATNDGRGAEIEERADEIQYVEYSAIFDKNLCEFCETADGETGQDQADLTAVPNPDCLGADACRCFHIAVRV